MRAVITASMGSLYSWIKIIRKMMMTWLIINSNRLGPSNLWERAPQGKELNQVFGRKCHQMKHMIREKLESIKLFHKILTRYQLTYQEWTLITLISNTQFRKVISKIISYPRSIPRPISLLTVQSRSNSHYQFLINREVKSNKCLGLVLYFRLQIITKKYRKR